MERRAQAVYVAGRGTLLGRGGRWLLTDAPAEQLPVEHLWGLLEADPTGQQSISRAVLAALEAHFEGRLPSLVLVDQTPGAEEMVMRGRGQVSVRAGIRAVAVGLPATGQRLPLVEGVVAAGGMELAAEASDGAIDGAIGGASGGAIVPGAGATAAHPLIDRVPPAVLQGRPGRRPSPPVRRPDALPSRRPAAAPVEPGRTTRRGAPRVLPPRMDAPASPALAATTPPRELLGGPDHDGRTAHRRAPDHLGHQTRETVLAWLCPAGHVTPAHAPTCRVCGVPVADQEPARIPRPRLGGLRLPGGQVIPLDRGVVFGRKPEPVAGGEDWPHLVHLPAGSTYLSRVHLQIELDGWHVVALDLGSRGGTTIAQRGRPIQRLRPREPHILEPGQVLNLADVYEVVFEVDPAPGSVATGDVGRPS
ncbi:FHA domain-containing protein [Nocardioides pacificus]